MVLNGLHTLLQPLDAADAVGPSRDDAAAQLPRPAQRGALLRLQDRPQNTRHAEAIQP